MTFFNKKEEVIDIELTQFGKYLLSKGRFKPEFYAFFDDDILYDAKFAGVTTEGQNQIESRIKDALRLKTQYAFSGIETEINRSVEEARTDAVENDALDRNAPPIKLMQPDADRSYASSAPLGNAKVGSDKAPAWRVHFLQGELSGSAVLQFDTKLPTQPIPQLDVEVIYETSVRTELESTEEMLHQELVFEDGTFIHLEELPVILEVQELNSLKTNVEFEIEIFEVEDEVVNGALTGKEILNSLKFRKPIEKTYTITENNIYVPQPADASTRPPVDQTQVDYYLDIDVDSEIDQDVMCKLKPVDKTKGIFSNRKFQCPDETQQRQENIYTPNTVFEDECED